MRQILIIEDDKTKIEKLKELFILDELTIKESFQGGVLELKANFSKYSFLILDMTIPIWEKGNNDLGGNYEQFGGEKVMREMKRRNLHLPTIMLTMFDVFPIRDGSITFEEINTLFMTDFQPFYKGAVFYSGDAEDWKDKLIELIREF